MKNKGITILGSAASGKTTLIKELWNEIDFIENQFEKFNLDYWVENTSSIFYNNPLKAAKHLNEIVLPDIMSRGNNFILDTTGSNLKTLRKITDTPNYQFKAVIVYVNPIIAFIRNFSRDRKLPKQVLLENWLKVYSQIKDYQDIFGEGNIYIYETEYTQEEQKLISKYNSFWDYIELNPGEYISSFRKENTIYTNEQIESKEINFNKIKCNVDYFTRNSGLKIKNITTTKDYIKEELSEWIN